MSEEIEKLKARIRDLEGAFQSLESRMLTEAEDPRHKDCPQLREGLRVAAKMVRDAEAARALKGEG